MFFLVALAVLFSLVTLPVESNASSRALYMLRGSGLVSVEEYGGARAVASFFMALAQLMYFVLLAIGLGRR